MSRLTLSRFTMSRFIKLMMALEELHRPLVPLGRRAGRERAEVAPLAGPRIYFPRIQPEFSGLELADHGRSLNFGITWGSTYQGALESQKITFCGRAAGSPSSSPAGTRNSFLSRIRCGTRDPQRVQKKTV